MVLILGISLFYAGLKLFSADNQWWIAGGTFLLVTGLQIALWAIGIRLDFLGNQSTFDASSEPSFFIDQESTLGYVDALLESISGRMPSIEETEVRRNVLSQQILYVLRNPEKASHLIPFLQGILVSIERLRLQTAVSGEMLEETQRELIEAIANFRVQFYTGYMDRTDLSVTGFQRFFARMYRR